MLGSTDVKFRDRYNRRLAKYRIISPKKGRDEDRILGAESPTSTRLTGLRAVTGQWRQRSGNPLYGKYSATVLPNRHTTFILRKKVFLVEPSIDRQSDDDIDGGRRHGRTPTYTCQCDAGVCQHIAQQYCPGAARLSPSDLPSRFDPCWTSAIQSSASYSSLILAYRALCRPFWVPMPFLRPVLYLALCKLYSLDRYARR